MSYQLRKLRGEKIRWKITYLAVTTWVYHAAIGGHPSRESYPCDWHRKWEKRSFNRIGSANRRFISGNDWPVNARWIWTRLIRPATERGVLIITRTPLSVFCLVFLFAKPANKTRISRTHSDGKPRQLKSCGQKVNGLGRHYQWPVVFTLYRTGVRATLASPNSGFPLVSLNSDLAISFAQTNRTIVCATCAVKSRIDIANQISQINK